MEKRERKEGENGRAQEFQLQPETQPTESLIEIGVSKNEEEEKPRSSGPGEA